MSLPANNAARPAEPSVLAGSVLPIQRAEELLATLPGVISARIVAAHNGAVDEIHLLTTTEVSPKQTVRNVESALIAHLGMRVSHKKISVATSDEATRPKRTTPTSSPLPPAAPSLHTAPATAAAAPVLHSTPVLPISPVLVATPVPMPAQAAAPVPVVPAPSERVMAIGLPSNRRRIYFEDVEVRRSRAAGITCRVTLRKGDETFIGEAEGVENERVRIELAARATLKAMGLAEDGQRQLSFVGCKIVDAFDHEFVFVGITQRHGRESTLTTGSAEVRESPETAGVLAVLDATNRWLDR